MLSSDFSLFTHETQDTFTEVQVSACQALYISVVYFLFMSFSIFIVSVCCAAGGNFSGEVLEAVAAGLDLADGVCLAIGMKWYSCSCAAASFRITAVQEEFLL